MLSIELREEIFRSNHVTERYIKELYDLLKNQELLHNLYGEYNKELVIVEESILATDASLFNDLVINGLIPLNTLYHCYLIEGVLGLRMGKIPADFPITEIHDFLVAVISSGQTHFPRIINHYPLLNTTYSDVWETVSFVSSYNDQILQLLRLNADHVSDVMRIINSHSVTVTRTRKISLVKLKENRKLLNSDILFPGEGIYYIAETNSEEEDWKIIGKNLNKKTNKIAKSICDNYISLLPSIFILSENSVTDFQKNNKIDIIMQEDIENIADNKEVLTFDWLN